GKRIPTKSSLTPRSCQYGEMSKIGSQLLRMLSHVDKQHVHIVILDDLKRDPLSVYKKVLAFLDIPYDGMQDFAVLNESRQQRSTVIARSLVWASDVRRRLHIPGLGLDVLGSLYRMNLKTGKAGIDLALRAEMQSYFRDEIKLLSKI